MLTSCLATIKKLIIKYCERVYERSGKNLFWSIGNSGEVLNRLKSRGFCASSLSTYDFSTLYTTLPHSLVGDKLVDLVGRTFQGGGSLCVACQKVCEAPTFLLGNIYSRIGSKLCGQIVSIPVGTDCAPLVPDLFLFCCGSDFVLSLSEDSRSDVIGAFNSAFRCLGGLFGIGNNFFDSRIYPSELQLNRAGVSDAET